MIRAISALPLLGFFFAVSDLRAAPRESDVLAGDGRAFLDSLASKPEGNAAITRQLEALRSPEFAVRERAYATLSASRHVPEPLLSNAEKGADLETRHRIKAIRNALAKGAWKDRATRILREISSDQTPGFARTIVAALPTFEDGGLAELAHDALRKSATESDSGFLAEKYRTAPDSLRASITTIFAALDDPFARDTLRDALADPLEQIRLDAALAVGGARDPACLDTLVNLLDSPSALTRYRAVSALRQLTGKKFDYQIGKPGAPSIAHWADWLKKREIGKPLRDFQPEPRIDLLAKGIREWRLFQKHTGTDAIDPFAAPKDARRKLMPGVALAKSVTNLAGEPATSFASISNGSLTSRARNAFLRPPGSHASFHLTFEFMHSASNTKGGWEIDPFGGRFHVSGPDGGLIVATSGPDRHGDLSGIRLDLSTGQIQFLGVLEEQVGRNELKVDQIKSRENKLPSGDSEVAPSGDVESGGWKKVEVVLAGGQLEVYWDGLLVSRVAGISEKQSGILFERRSANIAFRRILILPLK